MLFYHLTLATFESSIQKKGLEPSVDDLLVDNDDLRLGVNLAATLDPRYRSFVPGQDVICVIDGDRLNRSKLLDVDGWWWRYLDAIPPEVIIEFRKA